MSLYFISWRREENHKIYESIGNKTTRYGLYLSQKQLILFLPDSTEGVAQGATTAMDYENAADSTESSAETVIK